MSQLRHVLVGVMLNVQVGHSAVCDGSDDAAAAAARTL